MSQKYCCVPGCPMTLEDGVPLHRFPNPDTNAEKFKSWITNVGGEICTLDHVTIYNNRRVCRRHFEDCHLYLKNRLSKLAIPVLHVSGRPEIQGLQGYLREQVVAAEHIQPSTSNAPRIQSIQTGSENAILHAFPNPSKEKERFLAWVNFVGSSLAEFDHKHIFKNRKICHNHFEERFLTWSRRLSHGTVPSLNMQGQKDGAKNYAESKDIHRDHDHTYYSLESQKCAQEMGLTAKRESNIDENDTIVAIDDPYDAADSNTSVPEQQPPVLFSWVKTEAEVVGDGTMEGPEEILDLDVSMFDAEKPSKDIQTGGEFTDYRCNECGESIKGFRYTCVQCADFDLCAACEARARHAAHYVLRVPGARPYKEIQAVLAAIRHKILRENLFMTDINACVKEEVKDEEPDPLGAWGGGERDDHCDVLENYPERNDEDGFPPRKRRRTSLDPNKDSTLSDDGQTCDPSSNYPEPIEIDDINKLTKTNEQTDQRYKQDDSDIIQNPNENLLEISKVRCLTRGNDILDYCKPKLQHATKRQKLIHIYRLKTPSKISKYSYRNYRNNETHSERIGTHRKEICTYSKKIGSVTKGLAKHSERAEALSKTKIGTCSKEIHTDSKEIHTDIKEIRTDSKE